MSESCVVANVQMLKDNPVSIQPQLCISTHWPLVLPRNSLTGAQPDYGGGDAPPSIFV